MTSTTTHASLAHLDPTWTPRRAARVEALPLGAPLPTLSRNWTLFLLPHSHTDIGFTDAQPACLERHSANIDSALLHIDETRDSPEGARLKWNVEAALQLEHFALTRPQRQVERLVEACRRGDIGIEALWGNMLTGLCSTEELCRLTYTAAAWRDRYGIQVETAMLSDVCGYVWNVPQILVRSGVRFLSCALNNRRAPFFTHSTLPPLFYWEGPDGSRLLTWFSDVYAYARMYRMSVDPAMRPAPTSSGPDDIGVPAMARRIMPLLAHLETTGYPYDALVMRTSLGDNQPVDAGLARAVHEFNAQFGGRPFLRIALSREFATFAEQAVTAGRWPAPPVIRGEPSGYWEDGAGSSAAETALVRQSQRRLFAAEAKHALASLHDPTHEYPAKRIRDAVRYLWLYDEHTWGANVSVRQPDSLQTRLQWRYKSDYAHESARIASAIDSTVPAGRPARPLVGRERQGHGAPAWNGSVLENDRFRIEFDAGTGTIVRLHDKALGRELTDPASPFRLNQYWYEQGPVLNRASGASRGPGWLGWLAGDVQNPTLPDKDRQLSTAAPARPELIASTPEYDEVRITTAAPGCERLTQRVRLYRGELGIEFVNELDKVATMEKEAGYFTFPLAPRGEFRVEAGGVPMRPEADQVTGACRDWYAAQRYAAVSDADATVLLQAIEAPLICVGGLTPEQWLAHHPQPWQNGTLVSWAFNNHWQVNYQARQGGRLVVRYRLGVHAGAFDAAATTRWLAAWDRAAPEKAPATLTSEVGEAVRVEPDHVELVALKRAEDGDGYVARLVELSGRPAAVTLQLQRAVAAARRAMLTEEPLAALDVADGMVRFDIEPHEIATVRLHFSSSEPTLTR